jgi:hypothetical protein
MNNISVHGGEDIMSRGSAISDTDPRSLHIHKDKTKIDVHYELNVLDQIVSEGNDKISTLKNDIRGNDELTFNVKSPTPVTTGCIRHSNKHGRKVKIRESKNIIRFRMLTQYSCQEIRVQQIKRKETDIRYRRWCHVYQMGIKTIF